jgi:hypothetical protein
MLAQRPGFTAALLLDFPLPYTDFSELSSDYGLWASMLS